MSTHNPYPNACQEWGERYGDYLYRAKNRRVVVIFAFGLAGLSVADMPYIGVQPNQLKRKKTDCRLTGLIDPFIRKSQP